VTDFNRVAVIRERNGLLGRYMRDLQCRGAIRSSEGDSIVVVETRLRSKFWFGAPNQLDVNIIFSLVNSRYLSKGVIIFTQGSPFSSPQHSALVLLLVTVLLHHTLN
jgi:hypothetical protein